MGESFDDLCPQLFETLVFTMQQGEIKLLHISDCLSEDLNLWDLIIKEFLVDIRIKEGSSIRALR